jgi:hypothetical protein
LSEIRRQPTMRGAIVPHRHAKVNRSKKQK